MSGTVFIVLFRGVGGATQLPVKRLREALTEAGFENVATYINSGNAVLRSGLTREKTREIIAGICKREFAFDKSIILRDRGEWAGLVKGNPFPEAVRKPTTLHAFVLQEAPERAAVESLGEKATGTERFAINNKTLYLHAPDGLGRSKFAPKIETTLKTPMTARNWNTVLKLGELAANAAKP